MIQLTLRDVGFVDAVIALDVTAPTTIQLRKFIMLAHRPEWKLIVYELISGQLVKLADVPGGKNGPASLLVESNSLKVFAPTRGPDPKNPNPLFLIDIPVPGIENVEWVALRRIRNLARIIQRYVPAAANEIDPYTK